MEHRIPEEAQDLLSSDVPVMLSYRDKAGRIISVPMWVEHDDGVLRFSTPKGSAKTVHLRRDPEIGLVFTDRMDPYRYLSISGRVTSFSDDVDLETIDRLAERYEGGPYPDREQEREVFEVEPTRVVYAPDS